MPGAGWNIVESSLEHIPLPGGNPDRADAIKLILAKGIQKQVVLYWYQSRGRIVASEYLERVYLVIDALNMHRTDASFVRLMAPVSNDDTGATARYLNEFAQLLIPALQEFIPGRTANGSQISSLSLLESGL
jgi:EpsI family protein